MTLKRKWKVVRKSETNKIKSNFQLLIVLKNVIFVESSAANWN